VRDRAPKSNRANNYNTNIATKTKKHTNTQTYIGIFTGSTLTGASTSDLEQLL